MAAVLLVVGSVSCAGESPDVDPGVSAELGRTVGAGMGGLRAERSTPFLPPSPPDGFGYVAVAAGAGSRAQEWGSDLVGTDAPYTVLAPGGDPTDPAAVVVTSATYGDRGGGLDDLLPGPEDLVERIEVGGREARWWPGDPRAEGATAQQALLRVALDDDQAALEVSGLGGGRDRFEAIATATTVDGADHRRAPAVVRPPDGLELVGSVDADGLLALQAFVQDGAVPGLPGSHVVAWSRDAAAWGDLVVLTLPRGSMDPSALLVAEAARGLDGIAQEVDEIEVGGAPGVVIDRPHQPGPVGTEAYRAVVGLSGWGEPVVAVARGAEQVPEVEELVALVEALRPATAAEWAHLVAETASAHRGSPQPGQRVLASGAVGGHRWTLEGAVDPPEGVDVPGTDLQYAGLVDPCIRFDTGDEVCSYGGGVGANGSYWSGRTSELAGGSGGPPWAPAVVEVLTRLPGASVRLTAADGTVHDAALAPVPGTTVRVAVLFTTIGEPGCGDAIGTGRPVDRVEVLDAGGTVLGCVPS